MNNYVYVGKIVNTHALKGEVRIISNFEYKQRVFENNNILLVGKLKTPLEIETYRVHKQYDMVKFKDINSIQDVIAYKGDNVYVSKESLNLNDEEVLIEDLTKMSVSYNDKIIGKIEEYRCDNGNEMIYVSNKYIPYNKDFIEKIDKNNYIIYYKNMGGLL